MEEVIEMKYYGKEVTVPTGYNWIGIDDDGSIGVFKSKPWRSIGFWDCPCNDVRIEVGSMDIEKDMTYYYGWYDTLKEI